jgi:sigma-B regulation protein RsbU (phosphoserine phosphatase)
MLCAAFFLISKLLNKPLKKLTDEVSQLGLGNLDVSIEVSTNDELGLLAQTFNKMTADLKASIEAYGHERAEKERINSDLRIATDIQADMLPKIFPPYADRDDLHIAAFMQAAKEVGGDFYDFFFLDEAQTKIALVIADVSGKGVPAALFMVIAKVLIKNNMDLPPDEVLRAVNNLLCADNNSLLFVTTYYSVLDIPTGKYTYASAGHNPVILYRKQEKSASYVDVPKAPPLATFPNKKYISQELTLQSGDSLLLYTDGVTEAFNGNSEMYGTERLLENFSKLAEESAGAVVDSLYKSVEEFAGGHPQSDDITMLFCKYIK